MNTALDIAKYTINKCIKLKRPVSNLQLQKILYYIQGEYMKKNCGRPLFNDNIEAWRYGPSIPNVYYEYNIYSSSEIIDKQQGNSEIENKIKDIINPIIEEKSKMSAWELVRSTHLEECWINAFKREENSVINKKDIAKQFCSEDMCYIAPKNS